MKKYNVCFIIILVMLFSGCNQTEKPLPAEETPIEKLTEEKTVQIEKKEEKPIDYVSEGGLLELPVVGASGYTAVSTQLKKDLTANSANIALVKAGQGFCVLAEAGSFWRVEIDGQAGWIEHKNCLVNLPDVIPSIVYNNTNSNASVMISSGKNIPNITGERLYQAFKPNPRLKKDEYIVPVLYAMAFKIFGAQQEALADGNTLIIYEGYRPRAVQQKVVKNLSELADKDPAVKKGLTNPPWSMSWFIATTISNHQRGFAIDVSLGKITKKEVFIAGQYEYKLTTEHSEFKMPTQMHELSTKAVVFKNPISTKSGNQWKTAPLSASMNQEAVLLQKYCTNAGLTPLASEWWHFDDWACAAAARGTGDFVMSENYSSTPLKP